MRRRWVGKWGGEC
jgi:hypothetical protein